jgi:hypothetical protein
VKPERAREILSRLRVELDTSPVSLLIE